MDIRELREFIIDSVKYIIIVSIILFIILFVIGIQRVVGNSMNPNFSDGNILINFKLHYNFFEIKRGEVISLEKNGRKVKRVIGLPGETIEFKGSKLFINGKETKELYIRDVKTEDFNLKTIGYDVIPKNMYFVMGDNRSKSSDSREFGLVKKEEIKGKIILKIYPITQIKLYK